MAIYKNALTSIQVGNHYAAQNSSTYFQTVTNDNPLLYYRMDCAGYTNPSVSLCPPAVNYGSSLVNGAYLPGVPPGGIAGPTNTVLGSNLVAAPINGVISCVDAGNDSAFNPTGTQPFTAMTWFRAYPADSRVQTIMSHGTTNWAMNLDGTTGRIVWNLYNGGQVTSTNVLNDGNWHFVAGVYDGTTSYFYADGKLNSSAAAAGGLTGESGAHIYLGGNSDYTLVGANQRYLAGAVAQAAFFTNALTAAQVQAIYSQAPPTISLNLSEANVAITYTGTLVSSTNVAGHTARFRARVRRLARRPPTRRCSTGRNSKPDWIND